MFEKVKTGSCLGGGACFRYLFLVPFACLERKDQGDKHQWGETEITLPVVFTFEDLCGVFLLFFFSSKSVLLVWQNAVECCHADAYGNTCQVAHTDTQALTRHTKSLREHYTFHVDT